MEDPAARLVARLWRERVRRLWRQLEAEHRLPYPVPAAVRAEVSEDLEEEARGACEAELPQLLNDYQGLVEPLVRGIAHYLEEHRWRLSATAGRSEGRRSQVSPSPRPRADSEFHRERRFRALAFVGERAIPALQAVRGQLTPPRRVPWKQVVEEWRAADPAEKDLKPEALKRLFRLALADSEVCRQYTEQRRRVWLRERKSLVEMAPVLGELSGRREDLESLAQELQETAEGLRAIADARPRSDALGKRMRSLAKEVAAAADKIEKRASAQPS